MTDELQHALGSNSLLDLGIDCRHNTGKWRGHNGIGGLLTRHLQRLLRLRHTLSHYLTVFGSGTALQRPQAGFLGLDVGVGRLDARLARLHVALGHRQRLMLRPYLRLSNAESYLSLIKLKLGDKTSGGELCTALVLPDRELLLCLQLVELSPRLRDGVFGLCHCSMLLGQLGTCLADAFGRRVYLRA